MLYIPLVYFHLQETSRKTTYQRKRVPQKELEAATVPSATAPSTSAAACVHDDPPPASASASASLPDDAQCISADDGPVAVDVPPALAAASAPHEVLQELDCNDNDPSDESDSDYCSDFDEMEVERKLLELHVSFE